MAEIFYRAVTQAVLISGLETWLISAAMEGIMEGTHTGFMRQITRKGARQKEDGMWVNLRAEVVQEAAGTYSKMTYIRIRQGTVS